MKQKCCICNSQRAKRECALADGRMVCPICCVHKRSKVCAACPHYIQAQNHEIGKYRSGGAPRFIAEFDEETDKIADQALELIEKGNFKDAESILRDLVARHPRNHRALFAQGTLHAFRNEFDDAIEYFDRCTRIFPVFTEAYFNKAVACIKKQDLSAAVRSYQQVVRIGDHGEPMVSDARKFLDDFERHSRDYYGVGTEAYLMAEDLFTKGFNSLKSGDIGKALELFTKSLAASPGSAQAHGNRGLALAMLGRRNEALAALDKALEIDPKYEPAILNKIAVAQLAEGEPLPRHGKLPSINYSLDYPAQGRSLIREMVDGLTGGSNNQ